MSAAEEEFLEKLREAFCIEAAEHLQNISSGLIALESGSATEKQGEVIETTFRQAHSLKGAARAVNRTDIESVCQALEGVFALWKKSAPKLSPRTFDVLNRATDLIGKLLEVAELQPALGGEVNDTVRLVREVTTAESKGKVSKTERPAETATPTADLESELSSAKGVQSSGAKLAVPDTIRVPMAKMDSVLLQAEELLIAKSLANQRALELAGIGGTIDIWRKEWSKADATLNVFRRMKTSETSSSAGQLLDFFEWNHSYMRALESRLAGLAKNAEADRRTIGEMVDGLLEDTKKLVMLPVGTLFEILPKLVRDLSRDAGKEVELSMRGNEVEIDKRILEGMKDALIHLVRNAIDHGIESPAVREQKAKSPRGKLVIAVSQRDGNKIEIVIADDGSGIEVAKVKSSAIKNGLLTAEVAEQMSDEDALALIFHSGVSSSPIVTEISGRGLGMAIVRENVEKLGGRIAIENRAPHGTTIRIFLPVTLATFKGLLVVAGGQEFIVPIAHIERVVKVLRADVHTVASKETIAVDGHFVSLTRLDDVLELPRRGQNGETNFLQAIVLAAGESRGAFMVDDVRDEYEVLVKPLGPPLVRVRNVAAATVLGAGKPVLILRVPDLLKSAINISRPAPAIPAGETKPAAKSVLVVDDSITARMLLKNILEAAGYRVQTAIDGADAWATMQAQPFDAVVSDVEMPRLDGFDLTAKIRAHKKLAQVPVVLVTALESREHRERGVDAGANAYIVKSSFDQTNLLDVLRKLA